ncbi:MAG: hypothetical protein ACOWWO_14290 [Peptococcaceae bacterium]
MGTAEIFGVSEVPTYKGKVYEGFLILWRTIIGPEGIPRDVVKVLEEASLKALRDPEYVKWNEERG